MNEWMEAEGHPTKNFKYRMGFHCTLRADAPHLSLNNRAWYKVEVESFSIIERPESQGEIGY